MHNCCRSPSQDLCSRCGSLSASTCTVAVKAFKNTCARVAATFQSNFYNCCGSLAANTCMSALRAVRNTCTRVVTVFCKVATTCLQRCFARCLQHFYKAFCKVFTIFLRGVLQGFIQHFYKVFCQVFLHFVYKVFCKADETCLQGG